MTNSEQDALAALDNSDRRLGRIDRLAEALRLAEIKWQASIEAARQPYQRAAHAWHMARRHGDAEDVPSVAEMDAAFDRYMTAIDEATEAKFAAENELFADYVRTTKHSDVIAWGYDADELSPLADEQ
jgi:hypothetical protein